MQEEAKTTIEYEVKDNEEFELNLLVAADNHYVNERYIEALNLFKSALKTNANALLYANIGNCYYKLEEFQLACENWVKACELDSDDYRSHLNLGNFYYKSNDIENAIYYWGLAILINPKDEKTYLNLASVFDKKDMRFESVKYFEIYLKIAKDKSSASYIQIANKLKACINTAKKYLALGVKYQNNADYDNACECYRTSLSNYPNLYETNKRLGDLLFIDKNFKSALKYWETALELSPQNSECEDLINKLKDYMSSTNYEQI